MVNGSCALRALLVNAFGEKTGSETNGPKKGPGKNHFRYLAWPLTRGFGKTSKHTMLPGPCKAGPAACRLGPQFDWPLTRGFGKTSKHTMPPGPCKAVPRAAWLMGDDA